MSVDTLKILESLCDLILKIKYIKKNYRIRRRGGGSIRLYSQRGFTDRVLYFS